MSRRRVARLMREAGLRARAAKLYRRIPGLHGFFLSIPNRQLDRMATGPDQVWVGDVTYIKVGEPGGTWPSFWIAIPGGCSAGAWRPPRTRG